jgi:TolB-like protein/predicted TPR repeat methyltransferase
MLVLAVAFLGWRLYTVRQLHGAAPVSAATATAPAPGTPAQSVPAKSIAVLPFENLSGDKDNQYFVDGMQDLILTKLADINDLKVISRTSTEKYKSRPENLKQVAAELGVATILEGSVQKQGNQVLINVQLIDTRSDSHIWAKAYTKTLTDVFGVEGEVAEAIAASLDAKLSPAQTADLAAAPTTNRAAYDAFLRAEYLANRSGTDYQSGDLSGFKAAIPLYRQAVQADPAFALAWARLSHVESELAWLGSSAEDIAQLKAQARTDADEAVKLAPQLAAAQIALGYTEYYGRGDYPAALEAFAAALRLKPNDPDALAAQGYVQRRQGRFDAAIASLERALALDPRNSLLAFELGITYMQASRFAEAEQSLQHALALDPHNLSAQSVYPSAVLFASGDLSKTLAAAQGDSVTMQFNRESLMVDQRQYAEALVLLDAIPDTPDNFPPDRGLSKTQVQADLYQLMGDTAKARVLYAEDLPKARAAIDPNQQKVYQAYEWQRVADDELGLGHTAEGLATVAKAQALVDQDKTMTFVLDPTATVLDASLYAQAQRPDLAVPLLARALAMPGIGYGYSPVLLWLDPGWNPIRDDPRFKALLQRYVKYKPAVPYATPHASAGAPASPQGAQ